MKFALLAALALFVVVHAGHDRNSFTHGSVAASPLHGRALLAAKAKGKGKGKGKAGKAGKATAAPAAAPGAAPAAGCPAGQQQQQCANPCFTATPPLCAEARGKALTCQPNYCGTCSAQWMLNGQAFSCPTPQPCSGKGCCAASNMKPRDCSQFACNSSACKGAASCTADTCNECAPIYKDASGNTIPPSICNGAVNPAALTKCQGGASKTCCSSGYAPLQCNPPPGLLNGTCASLSCGSETGFTCTSNACDGCSLQVLNARGQDITHQCSMLPPTNICTKVQCPPMTGSPNCGTPPAACAGTQLMCIKDACACTWRWFSIDMEPPSPQCSAAIQICTAQANCPSTFQCDPLPAQVASQMPAAMQQQLTCTQAPCTCQPQLMPPQFGFRQACTSSTKDCCSDKMAPAQCPPQIASACQAVTCGSTKVTSCAPDGCNKCAVSVKNGNTVIPPANCRIPFNESGICPGTICPANTGTPNCGTAPTACGSDWHLRCIWDPCVCTRAIWVDEDIRIASAECNAAIQPPCATTCPKQFSCPGLPSPLKCMQEQCTCRPVVDPSSIPPNMQGPPQGQQGQGQNGQMPPGQGPPGQMGPGQMGPGQMGPGQGPPGQMGPPGQAPPSGQMAFQGPPQGGQQAAQSG